jgi:hypothetical protein
VSELITGLLEREIGIVQMPCPELCAFGLDRAQVRVENALRAPAGQVLCRRLALEQVQQIQAYLAGGIRVLGILGKNGSPSCGVEETWAGGVCPGPGAFMEALAAEIQAWNLPVEMTGMRDSESTQALAVVDRWLTFAEHRTQDQLGVITLGIAVLSLLALTPGAGAQPPPSIATIVEFNTVCSDCHAGECSGRLSFDSGPAAALGRQGRTAAADRPALLPCHQPGQYRFESAPPAVHGENRLRTDLPGCEEAFPLPTEPRS